VSPAPRSRTGNFKPPATSTVTVRKYSALSTRTASLTRLSLPARIASPRTSFEYFRSLTAMTFMPGASPALQAADSGTTSVIEPSASRTIPSE
jgi:hypothetical protein